MLEFNKNNQSKLLPKYIQLYYVCSIESLYLIIAMLSGSTFSHRWRCEAPLLNL